MSAVITALTKAFGQLLDPAVVRVLVKSVAVTLLVFAGLAWALWFGIEAGLQWAMLPFLPDDYEGPAAAVLAFFVSAVLFWLLFRIVAVAVLQFFADEIVAAVEHAHYPDAAARAKPLPLHREIAHSLKGIGRALLFNILALPVAAVLLITAIGPAAVFLLVNAVLLGRELTDMAWLRHCEGAPEANPAPAFQRLILGGVVAAIMVVPFANFLAPILGAAAGTHLAHLAMGSCPASEKGEANDA
jgi:CysZ protein